MLFSYGPLALPVTRSRRLWISFFFFFICCHLAIVGVVGTPPPLLILIKICLTNLRTNLLFDQREQMYLYAFHVAARLSRRFDRFWMRSFRCKWTPYASPSFSLSLSLSHATLSTLSRKFKQQNENFQAIV